MTRGYYGRWTRLFLAALLGAALIPWRVTQADAVFLPHDLKYGDISSGVHELQVFLNTHGFIITESGGGAPGHETSYFGLLTRHSLTQFQIAHALPATGFFGPLTRAAMNAIQTPPNASSVSANDTASTIPDWLSFFNQHAPIGMVPGFGGGGMPPVVPAAPLDTTPPSVALTAPTAGSTLLGAIPLSASASDDTGVANVRFYVDNAVVGAAITSSPFSYSWDSTSVSDGSHTILAVARDAAGNSATSSTVSITTENTALSFGFISGNAPGDQTATISWSTNQLSDSKVLYGLTTAYGLTGSSATFTTSHSLIVPTDPSGGIYHYIVVSKNAAGATATSSDHTFLDIEPS